MVSACSSWMRSFSVERKSDSSGKDERVCLAEWSNLHRGDVDLGEVGNTARTPAALACRQSAC
jgi:hypothetical protein